MHALGPRVNVFFTHLMTMLFVLVGVGSSGSYLQLRASRPAVDLRVPQVAFLRSSVKERCDEAFLKLDLDADFRAMWTWNIHHMYIYVVAEYATEERPRNEVVVWDYILGEGGKEGARVNMTGRPNKYRLRDYGYGLRGRDVEVRLKYNILPYMGPLFYGEEGVFRFQLPANYTGKATLY